MTKQRYTLLMHGGAGAPLFCELEYDEWVFVDNNPKQYQIFVIDGKDVCVLVATEDRTMKRSDALKCASSFVYGRYEKIEVDLKRLIGTEEKGIPIGVRNNHPPY